MAGFLVIGLFGIFFCLAISLDKLLNEIFKSDIGNIQKDIYNIKTEIERIERKINEREERCVKYDNTKKR